VAQLPIRIQLHLHRAARLLLQRLFKRSRAHGQRVGGAIRGWPSQLDHGGGLRIGMTEGGTAQSQRRSADELSLVHVCLLFWMGVAAWYVALAVEVVKSGGVLHQYLVECGVVSPGSQGREYRAGVDLERGADGMGVELRAGLRVGPVAAPYQAICPRRDE